MMQIWVCPMRTHTLMGQTDSQGDSSKKGHYRALGILIQSWRSGKAEIWRVNRS